MAELADAPDLGSGGRPCRFKSCYPHKMGILGYQGCLFLFARHGRALTGVSPEHAQVVGSV